MDKAPIPEAGNWTFDTPEIATTFDRHVREQLPWYDLATGIVINVARHFIPEGGRVADVGASTGNIGLAISRVLSDRKAEFIPYEPSGQMARVYGGPGRVIQEYAEKVGEWDFDLIICFLVLQFVAPAARSALLSRMKRDLRTGGAIVVFDKVQPRAGDIGALSLRLTLAAKYEAGATPEEIIRKELALAGAQRPLFLEELAGFEPIFRFGDFGGWLFTREPRENTHNSGRI